MSKKICIIGGGGFIGTALTKMLVDNNAGSITVIDTHFQERFEKVIYINKLISEVDLKESKSSFDMFIYLAGNAFPGSCRTTVEQEMETNVYPFLDFLERLKGLPFKKLIYVSSGGVVYGNTDILPLKEDSPTNPISFYGINKLLMEKYVQYYSVNNNYPVIIVRPSTAYGPGQNLKRKQGFISQSILNTLKGQPIEIFGHEKKKRDYIYINDLSSAIFQIMNLGKIGEIYNIGSNTGYDNFEIINILKSISQRKGLKIDVNISASRTFDVNNNILDNQKLLNLNWEPETDIHSGIEKTWKWIEQLIE